MKLRRVRIFGFKTFAEKTEFEIDSDLIAIVGPNGCGKSNIVDAILWALGEPNARNLRAATGTDVIFNGSARRKPLGYAEVTLLFDNEDGALPIDAAEVAISRRLTRAGDSHFAINRRTCRLKDVYDLLADSGLGRSGYAVVGQREIDQALSASPEDRRAWLDEAAGIQRFRAKRIEAMRRLESTRDHLERVAQLIDDLEFQREPLREEAERATRFVAVRDALREVEVGVLAREIAQADRDLASLESKAVSARGGLLSAEAELRRMERDSVAWGEEVAELERALDAERELRQAELTAAERAGGNVALSLQRLESIDELEAGHLGEQSSVANYLAEAEAARDAAESRLGAERSGYDDLRGAVEASKGLAETLKGNFATSEQALREGRKRQEHRREAEVQRAQARARLANLDEELERILQGHGSLLESVREAALKQENAEQILASANEMQATAASELQSAESARETEAEALRRLLAEVARTEGRLRGLQATIQALEGLAPGSSAVLGLVERGELPAVYRPVATALTTAAEYATTIETALGAAAHDLIVPSEADAKEAIHQLKERKLGRATFHPLSLARPRPSNLPDSLRCSRGFVGLASELVRCDPNDAPVIESLLGQIVVMATLDDALRQARTSGWSRIVTLDGEVIHARGAVTGGCHGRSTGGLVHRRAECGELEENLRQMAEAQREFESRQAHAQSECEALRVRLETAVRAADSARTRRDEARSRMTQIQSEASAVERHRSRIEQERSGHLETVGKALPATVDLTSLEARCAEAQAALAAHSAEASLQSARVLEARDRVQIAERQLNDADLRVRTLQSGGEQRLARLAALATEREELRERIAVDRALAADAVARASVHSEQLQRKQRERQAVLEASIALTEVKRSTEQAHQALAHTLRGLELERARAEARRASATQRLMEDYSLDSAPEPETLPEDASLVVQRLRREVRAMGDVNVGAIAAYAGLSERYEGLIEQRDDVRAAMEEVQRGVQEIEDLTRDRFLATFAEVREAFRECFIQLFGGGEADLRLTHAESVLTSGVDVEVALPGKRPQRLELLSGGERSLSAAALLFALLKVRPSPLVVLDEVDAPLDGRNVERFIEVLRGLSGPSQFMMVTHNPVTIEAAPTWLGVTMQEPGISTLIPCRLPRATVEGVIPDAMLLPG